MIIYFKNVNCITEHIAHDGRDSTTQSTSKTIAKLIFANF
jgi:hypothetical protein